MEKSCYHWGVPPSLSLLLLLPTLGSAAVAVLTVNVSGPVVVGEDVTLTCLYNSTPPTNPVTWTINGQRISNGSHFVVHRNVLRISAIDASVSGDANPYKCHVSGTISDSTVITLNISPVVSVQDVIVNESSSAILLCQNLRPSDDVTYSWEREGETLPNEVYADLTLPQVSRTDAGSYTCVASNTFGHTRESGQLIVQYLDLEAVSPLQIVVTSGALLVRVTCRADGYPTPTFSWTTPPDVPSSIFTIASNESVSVLEVSPADGGLLLIHSGLYVCGAGNAAHSTSVTFRIIVQDYPEMPNRLQVTMVTATSAQLSWRLPHDGNSPVERYYIAITAINGTAQIVLMTTGSLNTVAIETLNPASTYQFSVVAKNQIGNSSASEPLSFTTLGLPPDIAPFNLSTVIGLRSVNISVEIPQFSAGVSMVTGCIAQYESDGVLSLQSLPCGRGSLSALCPSTAYNISLAFVNSEGEGPWSESVGVTTSQGAPLPPEVSVAVESSTAVRVEWTLTDAACYSEQELFFTVQYQLQGVGQWTTVLNGSVWTTNQYRVVGLQQSTLYQFRVGVTSRNGDTALGVSQTVVTLIGALPTPDFIPPNSLYWGPNDPVVVVYFVLILEADDDVIVGVYNTSNTTISLTGLQDGRPYRARVRGVDGRGLEGEWSELRLFTFQSPNKDSVGTPVSVAGQSVEAMAVGITLGVLVCVFAVVMVVGLLAVLTRLRKAHTHSFHDDVTRRPSNTTIPEGMIYSLDQECKRKAGLLPRTTFYQHHVHFTSDGGHTVTSSLHSEMTQRQKFQESPEFATCSLDVFSDSLPSVSSMEAEPSEVMPTTSGAWGENPVQIALVESTLGVEGADLINEGADLQLEPIVCDGEEVGSVHVLEGKVTGSTVISSHGENPVIEEKGVAQESPRSICLKRAASVESVV